MIKNILISIYVFLFLSHIIFGPYYNKYFITGEKPKYMVDSITDVFVYIMYITYLSMLFTIYFFIYPRPDTFIVAFMLSFLSLIVYLSEEKRFENDNNYYESVISHVALVIPFFYYKSLFKINLSELRLTNFLMFSFFILLFYLIFGEQIYNYEIRKSS